MLFFYIRHGDPIYKPDSLTSLGHRQSEALAHRLAQFGLDRIYTSPSQRARDTARPTCDMVKLEPIVLDWCDESLAWKDFTIQREDGKSMWLYQNPAFCRKIIRDGVRDGGTKWCDHPDLEATRIKEGMERVGWEADALFAELGYVHLPGENCYRVERDNNERVALFAHQGFGHAFMSHVLDIPYNLYCTHFDMGHSGMTVIEFANHGGYAIPKVLQLSNDSHLWRDGIPTYYQNFYRF